MVTQERTALDHSLLSKKDSPFSYDFTKQSLYACTPTFPIQSPNSQMYWEGTQIPGRPNKIIPIQAEAAWKSTFKAH
jgi:hypothetical protein